MLWSPRLFFLNSPVMWLASVPTDDCADARTPVCEESVEPSCPSCTEPWIDRSHLRRLWTLVGTADQRPSAVRGLD